MHNTDQFQAYINAHLKAGHLYNEYDDYSKKVKSCENQISEAINPFFTLTPVTQEEFSLEFEASPISYGIIQLPYALVNVVQGIYHFALGLFSKMHRNIAKRDFEEAYGRILVPFNKGKGAFHIQQAQFHQSSYTYFKSLSASESWRLSHERDRKNTTLQTLLDNPEFYIEKFELENEIDNAYLEKLRALPKELLYISIYNFGPTYKYYYLLSDEEFADFKLSDLKMAPEEVIQKRFFLFKNVDVKESDDITFNMIINGKVDVNILLKELPPYFYFLIPNSQLKEIDYSSLSDVQISQLLRKRQDQIIYETIGRLPFAMINKVNQRNNLNYYAYIPVETIAKLTKDEVQIALKCLSNDQLKVIKVDVLKELTLTCLRDEALDALLSEPEKVQCLTSAQIEPLYSGKSWIQHLTVDQYKSLNFEKVQYRLKLNLFTISDSDKLKKVVQALKVEQVSNLLESINIGSYLTDDQIINLADHRSILFKIFNNENPQECSRRFDLLEPGKVVEIINEFWYLAENVSDNLLKKLDLKNMEYRSIQKLLGIWMPNSRSSRMNLLSDEQFESILSKLKYSHFQSATIDQLVKYYDRFDDSQRASISLYCQSIFSRTPINRLEPIFPKLLSYEFLTQEQFADLDFTKLDDKTIKRLSGSINFNNYVTLKQLNDCVDRKITLDIYIYAIKERLKLTDKDVERIKLCSKNDHSLV